MIDPRPSMNPRRPVLVRLAQAIGYAVAGPAFLAGIIGLLFWLASLTGGT